MKKVLNKIVTCLVWLLMALAITVMVFTVISTATLDRKDRNLFGYHAFIVLSDSMSATDFSSGDIVLVKETDPKTLQPGDIIAFVSQNNSNYGEIVTHKVRSLTTDSAGSPAFVTYGTTTDTDDETVVPYSAVIGRYQSALPNLGSFFMYLKTVPGYICCVLVPFLILIGIQGANCIQLFRRYKKERMAEMELERKKIEEERVESQRMLEELRALREQMGLQNCEIPSTSENLGK